MEAGQLRGEDRMERQARLQQIKIRLAQHRAVCRAAYKVQSANQHSGQMEERSDRD